MNWKKLLFQYSDSEFLSGIIEIHGTLYQRFNWIFKSVGVIVFRIWNSLINPTKYNKMLKMEVEWFIWAIVLCASLTASISKESILTYCYWCVANSLLSFDIIRHFQFSCQERFYFVLFSTMNSSLHWKKKLSDSLAKSLNKTCNQIIHCWKSKCLLLLLIVFMSVCEIWLLIARSLRH